jgi:hypothetical protein
LAYVWLFLVSIYLRNYFRNQKKITEEDDNFEEDDYKRLFEFKLIIQDKNK